MSSEEISAPKQKRLQQCFEHASKQAEQENHDYACDLFISCLQGDPANLEFATGFMKNLQAKYGDNKKGSKMGLLTGAGARGAVKKARGKKEWDAVLEKGREALKLNPWDVGTLTAMAEASENLGHDECQLFYLKSARDANPKDPEINRVCAIALANRGLYNQAIDCWAKVEQAKPNDPEAPRAQGADPNSPVHTDRGEIRYSAPDRGLFAVERPESRRERWVCDGESVFEYRYETKTLVEYPLPEELQGKAIANGPLPFIFQAEADKLRRRYWLRLTTPPNVQGEIWLEAYPKHQQDRANFRRAEIILDARRMQPQAMQIVLPTGTMKHSYVFGDIKVNDPFGFLHGNPFSATTPIGWRKEVERPEPAQVGGRQQSPRR